MLTRSDPATWHVPRAAVQDRSETELLMIASASFRSSTLNMHASEPGQYGPVLSLVTGGQPAWYHFDGPGSTQQLTDAVQAVVGEYVYKAFGEKLLDGGAVGTTLNYIGQWGYQTEIPNWSYVRRRYLFSNVGRWMSEDPPKVITNISDYTYARNSPMRWTDPSGLLVVCCRDVRAEHLWERPWVHCELTMGPCSGGEVSSPVWVDASTTRRLDDGTCCSSATEQEIQACLRRHPYSDRPFGPGSKLGNNCQTSTLYTIGMCCLLSSWQPHWYAGNPRGRCLKGKWVTEGRDPEGTLNMYYVCEQWELPEWRSCTAGSGRSPTPRSSPPPEHAAPF